MLNADSHRSGYILAAVLGAIGGGLVVALATKAIPKMMAAMMQNMMAQMREGGCDPGDMGQRMMAGFGEAAQNKTRDE